MKMNKNRIDAVVNNMKEAGLDYLLISEPSSIDYLIDYVNNPGERMYVLMLAANGAHKLFFNKLFFVENDLGIEIVWHSDTDDATKTIADQLNINLVFIPKSATEIYQPLDKVVFGSLKSSAAAEYDDKFFHEDAAFTKSEAADLFVKLWGKVKKNTILEGWEKTRIRGDYIEMMDSYSSSTYDTSVTSFNSDSME